MEAPCLKLYIYSLCAQLLDPIWHERVLVHYDEFFTCSRHSLVRINTPHAITSDQNEKLDAFRISSNSAGSSLRSWNTQWNNVTL